MTVIKNLLQALILLSSLSYFECQIRECQPSQPHITLGDRFSSEIENSNSIYTIGFIVDKKCKKVPTVNLFDKERNPIHILKPFYKTTYSKNDENFQYSRFAYFVKIDEKMLENSIFWGIFHDKAKKYGLYQIPTNYKEEKFKTKIMVISDLDNSPVATSTLHYIKSPSNVRFDLGLHLGNFALNLEDDNGRKGDDFFSEIRNFITRVPYLIVPGSNDSFDTGKLFNFRFRMPGMSKNFKKKQNYYYSFDYKNVHIISLSVEYFLSLKMGKLEEILKWLKEDLEKAKKSKNTKFTIFMTNRPFYCSIHINTDCATNFLYLKPIEDLISKFEVNLVLSGHVHSYLRSKSFKNLIVGEKDKSKTGPVYIVAGNSGTSQNIVRKASKNDFQSNIFEKVRKKII